MIRRDRLSRNTVRTWARVIGNIMSLHRTRFLGFALPALSALIAGCPGTFPTNGSSVIVDGNRDDDGTSGKASGEPNGSFNQAIEAAFDAAGVARLHGTVAATGDLDVYALGPLDRGDRLIVDAATSLSPLDVSVGVFDAYGRLTYNNDDRGGGANRFLDSYVEWIVRHESSMYYLVVTHSAFAEVGTFTGTYTVDVQVDSGFEVPPPVGQLLLLNFDGGSVDSPVLGSFSLAPFNAADISPLYNGRTADMKNIIRVIFEQNFERFDVTVVTTDDGPLPPGAMYSIIHFGGFNRSVFGIAESVDLYNADYCDDAVVFVETFATNIFQFTPTAEEMSVAIANVGSHEAGHLLGLNHVNDDSALMDDQSAADAFIFDQEFKEAPLSSDIMPIGTQDDVLLLDEVVGPRVPG